MLLSMLGKVMHETSIEKYLDEDRRRKEFQSVLVTKLSLDSGKFYKFREVLEGI